MKTTKTFVRDLAERVLATFITAAVGVMVAAGPGDLFDVSFWETVAAAGVAAVLSLVKGLLAKEVGTKNSASAAPGV